MKKKIVAVAVSAAAIVAAAMAFAGCGAKNNVAGTYTVSMSSGEYYSTQAVQDFVESHPITGILAQMDLWTEEMFWEALTGGILNEDGTAFLTEGGVANYYTATLALDEDSSYTLTKKIFTDGKGESGSTLLQGRTPSLEITFHGDYTADGASVTLASPETATGNILTVGTDTMAQYFPLASNCLDFTVESADADDLIYPGRYFYYFDGLYFTESDSFDAMTVTVDAEAKSFDVK